MSQELDIQTEQESEDIWQSLLSEEHRLHRVTGAPEQAAPAQAPPPVAINNKLLAEVQAAEAKLERGELLTLPEAAAIWVYDLKRAVIKRG